MNESTNPGSLRLNSIATTNSGCNNQSMKASQSRKGDIAARGERIYQDRLRSQLEPQHRGQFVVIDVDTGEYELDTDHLAASDRAAAKRPGAPLYAVRIGSPSLGRIGGQGSQILTA
jgi:hypothetical protein